MSIYRVFDRIVTACILIAAMAGANTAFGADWPQWRGPKRDGVWTETGIIERFESPQLPIKWRMPISAGYSGPTVAEGRVYVMDRVAKPESQERVLCFDAHTGKELWSYAYDCRYQGVQYQAGPRCSVTIHEGRAYALGAVGHLHCLDAASGKVLWKRDCRQEYKARIPVWGISGSPLIEGNLVIVPIGGRQGACVIAFDKVTGREQWRALDDALSYSSPIFIEQARRHVIVCWTADRIVGLDPASGRLCWQYPTPWERWPIAIATPVLHGNLLLFSDAHKGTLVLRLGQQEASVDLMWHRRSDEAESAAALHCLMSTPLIDRQHIYGVDGRGVLRCLRLDTGEQLWEDRSAVPESNWATIHMVRNIDNIWMFNERGELIISRLSPEGFHQISRSRLIDPTTAQLSQRGGVCWSHPAFANKCVYARNDEELVCADLSAR